MGALFGAAKKPMDNDMKYSRAIKTPQYVPSDVAPNISELLNTEKYAELVWNIEHSNVSDEVKKFLKLAASRHIVFNYSKIADYYAHADAETQRLMEQSALIILDIDDAIANGYIRLSERMKQLIEEAKKRDGMVIADE